MVRRFSCIALLALMAAGCGQSTPTTPEQLVSMGRFGDAIDLCTRMIRANPRQADTYLYRGRAYHCRNEPGDLNRAIEDFTESIQLAPQDPEAYYSRALAYRDQGNSKQSTEDQQAARQLDPRLRETYALMPELDETAPTAETKPRDPAADEAKDEEKDKEDSPSLLRSERRRDRGRQSAASSGAQPGKSEPVTPAPAVKTQQEILE